MLAYIYVFKNRGLFDTTTLTELKKNKWCEVVDDPYTKQFFVFDELDKVLYQGGELVYNIGEIWECEVDGIQRYYGYPIEDYIHEYLKAKKNKKCSKHYWRSLADGVKCVKRVKLIRKVYPESNLSGLGEFFRDLYSKIKSFIL